MVGPPYADGKQNVTAIFRLPKTGRASLPAAFCCVVNFFYWVARAKRKLARVSSDHHFFSSTLIRVLFLAARKVPKESRLRRNFPRAKAFFSRGQEPAHLRFM